MQIIFTPRAAADIADIFHYIDARNPSGAQKVKEEIFSSIQMIEAFPHIGAATNDKSVRILPLAAYPYLIYYHVQNRKQEIRLIRIRHSARNR